MRTTLVFGLAALLVTATGACTGSDRSSAPPASASPARGSPDPVANAPEGRAPGVTSKMNDDVSAAAVGTVAPPAGSTPTEPPYDLAADRERRARAAKQELGARTITTNISDIFVVIGPPGWQGGAFESSVSLMRSAMAGYMNNRFGKKPAHAISVYLFPEGSSYEAFCKKQYSAPCIAHYGFYSPQDRYMVMNIGLGAGTLTHEIVHPLVEADFPEAPTWLNEGIASVFEAPVITKPGEIHGVKNWVGSSRVDLQACKLEYSIVSPK